MLFYGTGFSMGTLYLFNIIFLGELTVERNSVYHTIVTNTAHVLQHMEKQQIKYTNPANAKLIVDLSNKSNLSIESSNLYTQQVAAAIEQIWNDAYVTTFFKEYSKKMHIGHGFPYFLPHLARLQPPYTPSNQDIVQAYRKTVGMVTTVCKFDTTCSFSITYDSL